MVNITISLIKYLNVILITLYVFFSFKAIGKGSDTQKKKYYIWQYITMFFIMTLSNLAIYMVLFEDKIILFYGMQLIYFVFTLGMLRVFYPNHNKPLANNMCFLLSIGFLLLTRLNYTKAIKQFVMCVIITIIALFIPKIIEKAKQFRNFSYIYAVLGIGALALVLVMGSESYGAKLSITLGSFSVQPSEFVKISFVMFLAGILNKRANIKNVLICGVFAAIHVGILVLSKDLGTALIFCVVFLFVVYIASGKSLYLLMGLILGCVACYVGYMLFDHVQTRVVAFLNPWPLIDTKGYQITQSLFAIGTGGTFGMGIYQGMPESIPVVDEDFIFSAICEEYGVIFGIMLILITVNVFLTFIQTAFKCKDNFYRLCVIGFSVQYIFQVFLTIGGAIKFIPSTGVTLPLISYGRSSIVATILMLFVVQGIYINETKETAAKNAKVTIPKSLNNFAIRTTCIFSVLMCCMAVYLIGFNAFESKNIINNSYNKRSEVLSKKVIRGSILSRNYDILAVTDAVNNEDGYSETRNYPYGDLFAHVVGRTDMGKDGLEAAYDFSMLTTDANIFEKIFKDLNNQKYIGNNIVTTLDLSIQKAAYDALGNYSGAAVVMNPKTGEVLSMVSKPSYNPNEVTINWEDIKNSDDGLLLNRATNGLYTPGSIFKLITLYEYLMENKDTYTDYSYNCEGVVHLGGFDMQCSNKAKHGLCDLKRSLAKSCNCSFINIGKNIDLDKLNELCNKLKFNSKIDFELGCKSSSFELSGSSTEFDIAQTVIGQGKTLVTPMHMALLMCGIANEGTVMKPALVSAITNINNHILEEFEFEEYERLFDKEYADIIKEYMREVVLSGTAGKMNSEDYVAYGKTGTAQIDENGHANSWFTGFIEKDGRTYVIVVVVENINENTFPAVGIAKGIADGIK